MAKWEETANKIKPMINDNSIWGQIGYISNSSVDCEPILLSAKYENNVYPIVVEAPTGLNNPKYDWTKHMWVDQDAASNSERLTNAEISLKSVTEQAKAAVDASEKVQQALTNISKGQNDQMAQLANMLKLLAPVLAKENTTTGGATNA